MLYPPKKRAYSPENKKTKELSNLMNINNKFTGSGGSIIVTTETPRRWLPRRTYHYRSLLSQAFSDVRSTPTPTQKADFRADSL